MLKTQHATATGNTTVDNIFDGMDQLTSVTNPYYTSADPTYGTTQTSYDGLGRATTVTKQDGSIASVDFSAGNRSTSTDEASEQRLSCSDALGRLIEVDEPNAGVNGVASRGSVSITQLSRTPVVVGAVPANTASGTVTITGFEKSTTVTTQAATSAMVTITVGGSNGINSTSTTICNPRTNVCTSRTTNFNDVGTMQVSVNAGGTVFTSSAGHYGSHSNAVEPCAGLGRRFPCELARSGQLRWR